MPGGHGEKLRQQTTFLGALMTNPTVSMAARVAGVSDATASRWMADPAFKQRYADLRRQALAEAMALLQQTMLAAVATLRTVMLGKDTKPSIKIQAASRILELGLRTFEVEALETRVLALQAALEVLHA